MHDITRDRNIPGFLHPHRQEIIDWLDKGVSQRHILANLQKTHQVACSPSTLSQYITENDLWAEVENLKADRVRAEVLAQPPEVTPEVPPAEVFSESSQESSQNLSRKTDPTPKSEPLPETEAWQAPPLPFPRLGSGPWWIMDLPLLQFGAEQDADTWVLRDACEGTLIVGTTGSGKTSGSGASIARAFLERGFGGLILTAKADERQLWERYADQCGRRDQLCIIEPTGPFHLNFLDYEAHRPGKGAGLVENLVNLLYAVIEVHTRNEGNDSAQSFWESTGKQLLRNTLRVLVIIRGRIRLQDVIHFISESPNTPAKVENGSWKNTRCFGPWLLQALAKAQGTPQERVIEEARRYWLEEFAALADKTRSCIIAGFTARQDGFIEPILHDLFCTDTTLTPDMAAQGAIILIDLPVKEYGTVGLFTQMAWKYLFQLAIERRIDPNDDTRRPVFLWADEAQLFYSARDSLFQSTARSSRCATVYLTQNLPNFYGVLGSSGGGGHDKVNGFLSNLNTKIFHNNNNPTTNHWAAEMIGKSIQYRFNSGSSTTHKNPWDFFPSETTSGGMSEQIDYEVQPNEFLTLLKGGNRNERIVEAYFLVSGTRFRATGKHYFKTTFTQEQRT